MLQSLHKYRVRESSRPREWRERSDLVPAAICNSSVLKHEPTTADGKKENQAWAEGKIYPGKEKSSPANIFLLPQKP